MFIDLRSVVPAGSHVSDVVRPRRAGKLNPHGRGLIGRGMLDLIVKKDDASTTDRR